MFSNQYNKEAISGNLTSTISDHLPQFLFVPSTFSDLPSSKSNMYERNWPKFNKEDFISDYFQKDWDSILSLSRNDIDFSLNNFLMNKNELLDKHAPYRKLNKYKLKLKTKPWITPAIQKLILIKNNQFKKYIKLSDSLIKQEVYLKYKYYRNLLSTILKKSKQSYYEKFFQNNLNNIKNIQKGIRNLISLKQSPKSNIHLLSHNSETITGPKNIADKFI